MKIQSKKLKAALAASVLELVRLLGHAVTINDIHLDGAAFDESIRHLQMILGTYILGQGVADIGKERAKIEKGLSQ